SEIGDGSQGAPLQRARGLADDRFVPVPPRVSRGWCGATMAPIQVFARERSTLSSFLTERRSVGSAEGHCASPRAATEQRSGAGGSGDLRRVRAPTPSRKPKKIGRSVQLF